MLFLDTNSHLTNKPCNFHIRYHGISDIYGGHIVSRTNFGGGQNFIFGWEVFSNKRDYSCGSGSGSRTDSDFIVVPGPVLIYFCPWVWFSGTWTDLSTTLNQIHQKVCRGFMKQTEEKPEEILKRHKLLLTCKNPPWYL